MTSMWSLLLFVGLAIGVHAKLNVPKIQLLKQQSKVLSEQNPRNGPACFTVYIPQLDGITTQYEIDYTKCNTLYNQQTTLEDTKWQEPRNKLEQRGQYSCRSITDCSTIVGYVEAFECFAQMGTEQSKSMYTISADASEMAVQIQEYYRVIETSKAVCVNNAERTYVENTTDTYEQLNSCLAGNMLTNPTTRSTPPPAPVSTTQTTTSSY